MQGSQMLGKVPDTKMSCPSTPLLCRLPRELWSTAEEIHCVFCWGQGLLQPHTLAAADAMSKTEPSNTAEMATLLTDSLEVQAG